jgi:hypothetical protein
MRSMRLLVALIAILPAVVPSGCGSPKPPAPAVATKPSKPEKLASRPATWLQISPWNVEVELGAVVVFALRGFDNHDFEVKVRPAWSATRGTIDRSGRLLAPAKKGISVVTAEDGISGLKAYTVVYVGQEPLLPPQDPESKPKPEPEPKPVTRPQTDPKPAMTQPTRPVAAKKMVLLRWKVGGKGFRRRVVCSVACYAEGSRWVKLFAVADNGRMSLLQSRFAKAGTISNFSVDFPRAEVKWLEVRLYDRRNRLIARERRAAR